MHGRLRRCLQPRFSRRCSPSRSPRPVKRRCRGRRSTTVATCVSSPLSSNDTTVRPVRARSAASAPRHAPDLPSRLLCPHFARQGEGEHRPEAHGGQDRCQPDGRIHEQGAAACSRSIDDAHGPPAASRQAAARHHPGAATRRRGLRVGESSSQTWKSPGCGTRGSPLVRRGAGWASPKGNGSAAQPYLRFVASGAPPALDLASGRGARWAHLTSDVRLCQVARSSDFGDSAS